MKSLDHIINFAQAQYKLDANGLHGPAHWYRVFHNGMLVATEENADKQVVTLFAFLHDCKRENESIDPDHGLRAAEVIKSLGHKQLEITEDQIEKLTYACEYHNKGKTSKDRTTGTCWDADRLDLMRVGMYPEVEYLSTLTARLQETIDTCVERTLSQID